MPRRTGQVEEERSPAEDRSMAANVMVNQGAARVTWTDGLFGGLFSGTIHAIFWIVVEALWLRDLTIAEVFQTISSALLGPKAFTLGWVSVVLGIALHFSIAAIFGFIYASFAKRLRFMTVVPYSGICGVTYGLLVWFFMANIIIPVFHVENLENIYAAIIGHTLCYGFALSEFITLAHRRDVIAEAAADSSEEDY